MVLSTQGVGNAPPDMIDIRLDEEYERFYEAQLANGKKAPPPLDGRTLYSDIPGFNSSIDELEQILQQRQDLGGTRQ